MCGPNFGPNGGVPIPPEVHQQFPQNVQEAWESFHAWWREQDHDEPVSKSTMPTEVAKAYETMKVAPIPGYDGVYTGSDSCYVIGVESQMVE